MAQQNFMKKSNAPALETETAELELPDWSGMEPSSGRLSVDTAFELCEKYGYWFAKAHRNRNRVQRKKCVVEFTL